MPAPWARIVRPAATLRAGPLLPGPSSISSSSPALLHSHCPLLSPLNGHLAGAPRAGLPILFTRGTKQWKQRQWSDPHARAAKVQGLKSRAAFKLLEMDAQHRIFKPGQTVVDLGYAPGSWSQVAVERTKAKAAAVAPRTAGAPLPATAAAARAAAGAGRVVGIDLIPAQPPRGMARAIQGNFLSPAVRRLLKRFLVEDEARRREVMKAFEGQAAGADGEDVSTSALREDGERSVSEDAATGGGDEGDSSVRADEEKEVVVDETVNRPSYIAMERMATQESEVDGKSGSESESESDAESEQLVDVVLSDMSAPWPQTTGFNTNSLSNPYRRLMNTSGNRTFDHMGSMQLCMAALSFASDTLRAKGHLVCKFYMGSVDKDFEKLLKKMFGKVHREKPDASRKESAEAYWVAKNRKKGVRLEQLVMLPEHASMLTLYQQLGG